ncbi:MAG: histidinol phosphate phosphatase, partial [Solirubrobacterales bacterium]
MLSDYHLHLRPDEPGTTAAAYFTEANVQRYLAAARLAGIAEIGVSEHLHRFTQALEIWDHEWWVQQAIDDVDAYCDFV